MILDAETTITAELCKVVYQEMQWHTVYDLWNSQLPLELKWTCITLQDALRCSSEVLQIYHMLTTIKIQ